MKRRNRPERARRTLGALGNKNVPQGGVEKDIMAVRTPM